MELMTAQEARDNMYPKEYLGKDVVDYHIQNINRVIYLSSQAKHDSATYEMNMSRKVRYNTELDYEKWTDWEDKLNDIIRILRQKHYDLEVMTSYDVYEMRHITIKIKW